MKVTGTGAVGPAGASRGVRGAGGEGFRLPTAAPAPGVAQAASVSHVMGLEALLALQDVGGPLERRRRAVGRAGRILDVLDDVKLALLGGGLSGADLQRLQQAVREERAGTEDPGLEAVLDAVEMRAAVEVAKLEQARRAA